MIYFAIQIVKFGYGFVGVIPAKPYRLLISEGRSRITGKTRNGGIFGVLLIS